MEKTSEFLIYLMACSLQGTKPEEALLANIDMEALLRLAKAHSVSAIITTIDIHTKERKSNGCGYKTEHVGLGLRGVSKEQLEKGDRVIVKNANMYGM